MSLTKEQFAQIVDLSVRQAEQFVKQMYYPLFDFARHNLQSFYFAQSTLQWNGTRKTGQEIYPFLLSLPPTNHNLSSLDVHPIFVDSNPTKNLLVRVAGTVRFTTNSNSPRNFSHTFIITEVNGTSFIADECYRHEWSRVDSPGFGAVCPVPRAVDDGPPSLWPWAPGGRARGRGRCAPPGDPAAISPSWLAVSIKLVWDWVLHEAPVRLLDVRRDDVYRCPCPRGGGGGRRHPEALFTLAVSAATLGVVPGLTRHWARDTLGVCRGLVGANGSLLLEWVDAGLWPSPPPLPASRGDGVVCCTFRQSQQSHADCGRCELGEGCDNKVLLHRIDAATRVASNHKWIVVSDWQWPKVVIVNLMMLVSRAMPQPEVQQRQAVESLAKAIPAKHQVDATLDKYHSDEALVTLRADGVWDVIDACVIDLAHTWASEDGTFSPISVTHCLIPRRAHWSSGSKLLVMWTEEHKRAFIILVPDSDSSACVLHYAEAESGGPATPVRNQEVLHSSHYESTRVELSQLSERLYCISRHHHAIPQTQTVEIWDCNMPSCALRSIAHNENACQLVYGHYGFLFLVCGDRILVSDYYSGTNVAVLTCKAPDGKGNKKFKMDYTDLSFLL
ncbi:NTF2-related export protein 1/2 [Pelomyxa schiedti]|nr:NTF2-related export protein 1/2 [Pelomyxa schiedti]